MNLTNKKLSFAKSGLRIIAGFCLMFGSIIAAGVFFILAALIGLLEEVI